MKFLLYIFLSSILFIGCGYKPSSHYAKDVISGNVYVALKINIDNTENSIYVKDAMNEMILNQFDAQLTDNKKNANTFVTVTLSSVSHTSLSTDDDGYAKSYRTTVNISMTYNKTGEKVKTLTVSDYYDYSVDSDSTLTDQKKTIAVKLASSKALSNLFSKIAVNSLKE